MKLIRTVRSYLIPELGIFCAGVLFYLGYQFFGTHQGIQQWLNGLLGLFRPGSLPQARYFLILQWFSGSIVFYSILPALILVLWKGRDWLRYSGLVPAHAKAGLMIALPLAVLSCLALPLVLHFIPAFQTHYPFARYALSDARLFIVYELFYLLAFIGWEFFAHGFLLFPFEDKFGRNGALLICLAVFVFAHLGKPYPEIIGSVVAGLIFGILALETRTIWWGVILHAMVGVGMDCAVYLFYR